MENMTRREKIDHIWYYYKVHIIVGIIGLALVTNLVTTIVSHKECILNVTLLGESINSDRQGMLEKDMISKFTVGLNKKTAELIFINFSNDPKDEMAMAGIEKFQAMMAAKSIDIAVMDKDTFKVMAERGSFYNLDDIKNLSLIQAKELNLVKLQPEGTSSSGTYGIYDEGIKLLADTGYDIQDKVICIPSNTKHLDKAVECLNWLLTK